MHVNAILRKPPVTLRRFDELVSAAQLMREQHVGYIVVVEPELGTGTERPVGVLTDRDMVIAVIARAVDPRTLRVGDVMTQPAVTVNSSDSIEKALHEMRRAGVRRLPVVGQRGELTGVVSLDDLLEVLAAQFSDAVGSVRNEQVIEGTLRP